MFENVAGIVMLIVSTRYFFKLLDTKETRYYILTGLFFSLSLFIRPEYVLLVIPLLIILLWNRKRIRKTYAVLAVLSLMVSLGPFFILNNELYGSAMLTGQHLLYNNTQAVPISSFSMANLVNNSVNLINLTPILFLCAFLGLLCCIKNRIHLQYTMFLVTCLLILSMYFLSGRILPTDIHSSYVRYLLPIYILSLPFISYFIFSLKQRSVIILIVFVILCVNIFTVIPAINNNLKSVEGYARLSREVVNATEPDAVIFLDYWDKAIFPERKVGLVRELPEENRSEILAGIAIKVSEKMVPTYFLIERNFENYIAQKDLENELELRGYKLKGIGMMDLYELANLKGE